MRVNFIVTSIIMNYFISVYHNNNSLFPIHFLIVRYLLFLELRYIKTMSITNLQHVDSDFEIKFKLDFHTNIRVKV